MRGINLTCLFLLLFGAISASELKTPPIEMEEEDILTLDSEIEDLLEEEEFDEEEINHQLSQAEENEVDFSEEDSPTSSEEKSQTLPLNAFNQKVSVEEPAKSEPALDLENIIYENEKKGANPLEAIQQQTKESVQAIEINLRKVFSGSPIIYTLLFFLSTISVCVWLYSMLTIRSFEFLPPSLVKDLRKKLISNQFDEALDLCVKEKHFFCKMIASGILSRKHGLNVMIESMKTEGKQRTVAFWQRINILNEIAIIAPMLGLLGTVLGMFYAFYDLNRSIESVSLLFDGLGISVGTTVAGLVVAILAMILYSLAKYRLVRILASVENEAQTFAALIDTHGPNYLNKQEKSYEYDHSR